MKHHNDKSAFHWQDGRPSIFYTETAERAAKRLVEQARSGSRKYMDIHGRAVVSMDVNPFNQIAYSKAKGGQKA